MLVNLDYVLKKAQREHYAVGLFNAAAAPTSSISRSE